MIKHPQFRLRYETMRISRFKEIFKFSDVKEFPINSCLHILDNFDSSEEFSMVPHKTNKLLNINNFKKFVYHVTGPRPALDTDLIQPDYQGMIFTQSGVMTALANYKRDMMPNIMFYPDPKDLPVRPATQPMINYNPLFRGRVVGVRRKMRLLAMVLSNLINTINRVPELDHYIHIPLGSLQFSKQDFIRVFKKMDKVSMVYPEISSYIFLAHYYAILAKQVDLPKRGEVVDDVEIAEEGLDASLEGFDPDLDPSDFLTNMSEYFMEMDPLKALEGFGEELPYTTSIFEVVPPRLYEKINFVFTVGDNFIIHNLRDMKEMNGKTNSAILRIIAHVNLLASTGNSSIGYAQPEINTPPVVAEQLVTVDDKKNEPNAPTFNKPLTESEREEAAEVDEIELDKAADKSIADTPDLSPAQQQRAKECSTKYKSLNVGGKSIAKLTKKVDDTLNSDKVDVAVKDTGVKINTSSSVAELDASYRDKAMDRDIANILTSFNKQGMFLTDVKDEEQVDELNELRTITASYEDTRHRTHRIKFTIPKVDEKGRTKINGSLKAMTKQRVSNPICKVSPIRVTLNSNMNKVIVERNTNVAHDFMSWFNKLLAKCKAANIKTELKFDKCEYPLKPLAYEYTTLGTKYEQVTINDTTFFFNYKNNMAHFPTMSRGTKSQAEELFKQLSSEYGTFFGVRTVGFDKFSYFIKADGLVTMVNMTNPTITESNAFIDVLTEVSSLGNNIAPIDEFVELHILNKSVPVIFALAYRYGLTNMLNYCNVSYEVQDAGTRHDRNTSDVVIKFADKRLIIGRVPAINALLFAGLNDFDLSDVLLEDMDEKDVYYDLLQQKKLSINNIKGIDDFFDMFIDPMTRDALREQRMPTNVRDLVITAVSMLTTRDHRPAASATNFRFRGVEQITGIIYNEMARSFATYKHKSIGATNKFSMSDYTIKQRIMEEQLMENVNILNPLDDIKAYSKFSNAGSGGRSGETFMIPDRQFTEDSLGIVSEATVDNGKVGLNATLPFNPLITNVRGMAISPRIEDLEPENMLSLNSLVMPCVTQDDGKRANFSAIQSSHVVPMENMEPSRVRTGYEKVVAHKTRPPFAYPAKGDGVIEMVDEKLNIMRIRYSDGETVSLNIGEEYTNNCSNGFYVDQPVVINGFKVGDKFKKDDILCYNKSFFTPDPYSKQVSWNIGVPAHVALLDNGGTIEDASILTRPLCERMVFNPIHVKEITLTTTTNVHKIATVGTNVLSTDALMIFDESSIPDSMSGEEVDEELAAMLSSLNRATPRAGHSGEVVKIDIMYKCDIRDMSKSLQTIVKSVTRDKNERARIAAQSSNAKDFPPSQPLYATDKIGITDLTEETIIFRFYIKQYKGMRNGDKLFFDSSLKSVCSTVYDDYIETEDGSIKIEACTSARGIMQRIITSPYLVGLTSEVLVKCEKDILDIWNEK